MNKTTLSMILLAIPLLLFSCIGMNKILESPVTRIEVSKISDGSYEGYYKKGRWYYDLIIDVESRKINSIEIRDCPMKKYKSFQEINDSLVHRVIQNQSITIDALSGATITSRAFQKAAENALLKGMNE